MKIPKLKVCLFYLLLIFAGCKKSPVKETFKRIAFSETPGYALHINLIDSLIFVANGDAGISVFKLNGQNIEPVGHWDDPSEEDYARATAKLKKDSLLYIADTDGGVIVLNAKKPDSMFFVSNAFGHNIYDIDIMRYREDSFFVLVADQDDGLSVFDASYPGYLMWLMTLPVNGYAYGLFVDSTKVFVAQGQAGLVIFDFSNPYLPQKIGELDLPGVARDVFVQNNLAFVALKEAGFAIVDVSELENPHLLSVTKTGGYVWKVKAKGNRLFVASGGMGFLSVDISNPSKPYIEDFCDCDYGLSVEVIDEETVLFGGRKGVYLLKEGG